MIFFTPWGILINTGWPKPLPNDQKIVLNRTKDRQSD